MFYEIDSDYLGIIKSGGGKYMGHHMEKTMLEEYYRYIVEAEKSYATIRKYMRDLNKFIEIGRAHV